MALDRVDNQKPVNSQLQNNTRLNQLSKEALNLAAENLLSKDEQGRTKLYVAAESGNIEQLTAMLEILSSPHVDNKVKLAVLDAECNKTQYITAIRAFICNKFIKDQTAMVRIVDTFLAAYPDEASRVAALNFQTEYHGYDNDSGIALHLVARSQFPQILQSILEGYPDRESRIKGLLCADRCGDIPLHKAVGGSLMVLNAFLAAYDDHSIKLTAVKTKGHDGNTPLHQTALNNKYGIISAILASYPDSTTKLAALDEENKYGWNPVQYTMYPGKANFEGLKFILNHEYSDDKMKIEVLNNSLLTAVYRGHGEIVDYILSSYPDMETKLTALMSADNNGDTVMHVAIKAYYDYPDMLNKILAAFPDQDSRVAAFKINNVKGNNAFHEAAFLTSNVGLLGALFEACPNMKERLELINAKNKKGKTALACAIESGNPGKVGLILSAFPDELSRLQALLTRNEDGSLSLFTIYDHQFKEIRNAISDKANKLALLNARDASGNTWLQDIMSSKFKYQDILEQLLSFYPDNESRLAAIDSRNAKGERVMDLAKDNASPELLQLIKENRSNCGFLARTSSLFVASSHHRDANDFKSEPYTRFNLVPEFKTIKLAIQDIRDKKDYFERESSNKLNNTDLNNLKFRELLSLLVDLDSLIDSFNELEIITTRDCLRLCDEMLRVVKMSIDNKSSSLNVARPSGFSRYFIEFGITSARTQQLVNTLHEIINNERSNLLKSLDEQSDQSCADTIVQRP